MKSQRKEIENSHKIMKMEEEIITFGEVTDAQDGDKDKIQQLEEKLKAF